jgi:hypothetical protein
MAKGVQSLAEELKDQKGKFFEKRSLLGLFIVLIGVFALLNQFLPRFFNWNFFWAVLLILIGLYIIIRR